MATAENGQPARIELQQQQESRNGLNDTAIPAETQPAQELKPTDGGRDAWSILVGTLVLETLFWGFPNSYGVFQAYYSTLPEFAAEKSRLALVGTLATGIVACGAPVSALAVKRFPAHQRLQIFIGWPMCIAGLLLASAANSVAGLIATQGFLYGVGVVTLMYPLVSMLNEWWVRRKGMAFGLLSGAAGFMGVFLPFILQALLTRYGHRTTLRACAVAMAVLTAPLLPFFKPRLPPPQEATLARIDWSFVRQPLFWTFSGAVFVQGFGYSFPSVFLPSYARLLGFSATQGALLVSVLSIAQVVGQFTFGWLTDRNLPASVLATVSAGAAAIAALLGWGLAKSLAGLVIFSLLYGFFAFGFSATRIAMGQAVSDDQSAVYVTFSIFIFLQGIGGILVGPLSAALMHARATILNHYAAGLYQGVVILTGVSSAAAAVVIAAWHAYERILRAL